MHSRVCDRNQDLSVPEYNTTFLSCNTIATPVFLGSDLPYNCPDSFL